MAEGWLYDGRSGVRRAARIEPEADGIRIEAEGDEPFRLATAELTFLESRADAEVYGRQGQPGWRLRVASPLPADIAAHLPARAVYGGIIDRVGLGKALLIGAVISAAVLVLGYKAPHWVAPLVPFGWERKFGDALVGDLGHKFCTGAEGQKALDRLGQRLSPRAGQYKLRVVSLPMVNAVALPGGNIVLFEPLLRKAESVDEVAGVLGHEIAHIEKRHVTEAMIRHYSLGLLLSSFGGTTGANVDMLASTRYGRGAESEADEGAVESLRRAGISPVPTARFFERMARMEPKLGRFDRSLNYISTHPLSQDRRRRFLAAREPGRAYQPALSAKEWDALQNICGKGATAPGPARK
jgi:Zn-dependent protease with chaperone function